MRSFHCWCFQCQDLVFFGTGGNQIQAENIPVTVSTLFDCDIMYLSTKFFEATFYNIKRYRDMLVVILLLEFCQLYEWN